MTRLIQWLFTEDKHGDSPFWLAAAVVTGFAAFWIVCNLPG